MMDKSILLEAQLQNKRMNSLLDEATDLSRQIISAADRGDQVTVELLVAMREEPIQKMQLVRRSLENQRDSLPAEEGRALAALLNGEAPKCDEEKPLAEQVQKNARLLQELISLDERLSRKLLQEDSLYEEKAR